MSRKKTTYTGTIEHTEQPTKPPTIRWEVWLQQDGGMYRLLSDQHLRVTAAELEARPLPGGWARLVVTPEADA
jgi:hypothetical protein